MNNAYKEHPGCDIAAAGHHVYGIILAMVLIAFGGAASAAEMAATQAVMTPISVSGMAPFTLHAHGLNSTLASGDPLTAHYAWDFGDPTGVYNELVGWNAAHTYDAPGRYTARLTLTDQSGTSSQALVTVDVAPDTRRVIYVATTGNDANSGSSPSQAVRTYPRGLSLMTDDTTMLLNRGDVFTIDTSQELKFANCVIGAYGSGAKPEVRWVGTIGDGRIMLRLLDETCYDIVVQDVCFDSQYASSPERDICDAIRPGTVNITVRRCVFGDVTMALNTNMQPQGVYSYDNIAFGMRAYYLWGQGTDQTHVGNIVSGSLHEHDIRFGGITRVLIAKNHLTNAPKRTIWSMAGEYAYITGNNLQDGRLTVGPDHLSGSPAARFKWCVIERNIINKTTAETSALEVEPGAEHVMIRNNVVQTVGDSSISINGYSETYDRTTLDIRVYNNTGMLSGLGGRMIRLCPGGETISVANNMFVAPNVITGDNRSSNMFVEETDLSIFTFIKDNLWAEPADMVLVDDAYHYVWHMWPNLVGFQGIDEWASFPQTSGDAYARVILNEHYAPDRLDSAAVDHARSIPGVFTDMYGNPRPSSGTWTAGAVEFGSTGSGTYDPCPWDVTSDNVVGLGDLSALLSHWGPCPVEGPCDWDFDLDGMVALGDLNALLSNWGPCFTGGGGTGGGGTEGEGETEPDDGAGLNENPDGGSGTGDLLP